MSGWIIEYRETHLEPKYWVMTLHGGAMWMSPTILFDPAGYPVREGIKLVHYARQEEAEKRAFEITIGSGLAQMIGKISVVECALALCRKCRSGP